MLNTLFTTNELWLLYNCSAISSDHECGPNINLLRLYPNQFYYSYYCQWIFEPEWCFVFRIISWIFIWVYLFHLIIVVIYTDDHLSFLQYIWWEISCDHYSELRLDNCARFYCPSINRRRYYISNGVIELSGSLLILRSSISLRFQVTMTINMYLFCYLRYYSR
jgi:hypothetical protein